MKKNYFLAVGMLAFMLSFLAIQNTANAQLYINEYMASNDFALPGPQGDFPDWIEIYNAGTEDVMLGGYFMYDTLDATQAYQIPDTYPDSVTVLAGGYILFYANKGEESSVLNLDFKLSGGGEQVGLWNPGQELLDGQTYGEQIADTSLGRYPDGTDNWALMADFTPGASNTNPNPGAVVELYINEFMASNDFAFPGPQGDFPDWIEIYNAGVEDVMLGGYLMYDTLDGTIAYPIPDTYPDSVTVAAGGFILFYANKGEESSVLNLNFKLSGGGEQVGLWNPAGDLLDGQTYGEQIADTSYGRFPDGSDTWGMMDVFTPGAPNQSPLAVNEIENNVSVSQNFPNPFKSETNIQFTLQKPAEVTIEIFDVRGVLVKEIVSAKYSSGVHDIRWEANDLPAGYYYYTLQTGTEIQAKKALIIK